MPLSSTVWNDCTMGAYGERLAEEVLHDEADVAEDDGVRERHRVDVGAELLRLALAVLDDAGDREHVDLQRVAQGLGHVGAVLSGLGAHHSVEDAVFAVVLQEAAGVLDEALELLVRRPLGPLVQHRLEAGDEALVQLFDGREQQVFLRGEVPVERAGRHVNRACELCHRRRENAAASEQRDRRVENLLPCLDRAVLLDGALRGGSS